MFIKIEEPVLILEAEMVKNMNPKLIEIVVIHELYHKYGQNMNPDMKEVKYLRDFFGQNIITEMDIDADVETFLFFKNSEGMSFEEYMGILYDTSVKEKV